MATSTLYFTLTIIALSIPYCMGASALYSGKSLKSGQYLQYDKYKFIMQYDCNLVLYGPLPIWASDTYLKASNCYVTMQRDGNLVLYAGNDTPLWASNTNKGEGNYVLVLQRDRNVVIYGDSLWATNTNLDGNGVTTRPYVRKNVTTTGRVVVNEIKTSDKNITVISKN